MRLPAAPADAGSSGTNANTESLPNQLSRPLTIRTRPQAAVQTQAQAQTGTQAGAQTGTNGGRQTGPPTRPRQRTFVRPTAQQREAVSRNTRELFWARMEMPLAVFNNELSVLYAARAMVFRELALLHMRGETPADFRRARVFSIVFREDIADHEARYREMDHRLNRLISLSRQDRSFRLLQQRQARRRAVPANGGTPSADVTRADEGLWGDDETQ